MKFRITFKDPDGVDESIWQVVTDSYVESIIKEEGLECNNSDEFVDIKRDVRERLHDAVGKWISGGEYLTIEVDTDAGTAIVVENTRRPW